MQALRIDDQPCSVLERGSSTLFSQAILMLADSSKMSNTSQMWSADAVKRPR